MEVKKQSFFEQLRKLAAHLDRGKKICQNTELDGQSQTTCINSLKGYAEELQEKLVETKKLYEDQEAASVKFQSFLDLAERVIDQQTIVLQTQESFMEQYGYVTYEKSGPKKVKKTVTEEPEAVSPTEENNASPEKTSENVRVEEESQHTPKLEDFGLSHYTMLQLQKAKMSFNRPGTECVTTPTVFQHNGLFMSPSVWGKMPPLYTPDARNTTQETFDWQEFAASSAKRNPFQLYSSKKIRKNLQMEMNNNDDDILTQCPSAPSLKTINLQNLNLDIYQLPPTPKSATKMTVSRPAESVVKKPKDYLTEELPQPPNLSVVKIQASNSRTTLQEDSIPQLEVPFSSRKKPEARLVTPSPPLLHMTLNTPDITSEPVFSCRSKKTEKINYFEKDIPEPPKLTGIYHYKTRNKENRPGKNNLI